MVVVTHDGPRWVARLFRSLPRTRDIDYEVVVVDNRSRAPTRLMVTALSLAGRINRLCLLDRNTLFAEGNNVGVAACSRDAPLVLLLNSDVEVRDPRWLRRLVDAHERGATSLGYVEGGPWPRAEGYCLLVDRDLYLDHRLDEGYAWWWGVTRLQARLLADGHRVLAVREHDDLLVHFGGKSGEPPKTAAGMAVPAEEVRSWFGGHHVQVRERL
jgi:hypothetical protein